MGKATIVSEIGEGKYTIRKEVTGMDGELARLATQRAALEAELPKLRNTVGKHWDEAQIARQTMQALLDQYIEGVLSSENPPNPLAPTAEEKDEVLRLVNDIRTANGLDPLTANETLAGTSDAFADDLARTNRSGHTGSDGSQPKDRVAAAGYDYQAVGENMAAGQRTPQEVVNAWMNSPAHRANILSPAYTELGVGGSGNDKTGKFWVQNFGTPA